MLTHSAIKDWLNPDHDSRLVTFDPPRTIRELRGDVERHTGALMRSSARLIALDAHDPYTFVVYLLSCLYAQKVPILFTDAKAGYTKFESHYEAVLTNCPDGTFPRPSILSDDTDSVVLGTLSEDQTIGLYTSGSTGVPKAIFKTLKHMDDEARLTGKLWREVWQGKLVASSVDPHHLYGLTFNIWLAMSVGCPLYGERIRYTEMLADLAETTILVTTPTFLEYCDTTIQAPKVDFILSAAGKLAPSTVERVFTWLGKPIYEIYGSTETGAIASRAHEQGTYRNAWTLLDEATLEHTPEGWSLTSPLVVNQTMLLDDELRMLDSEHRVFELIGRKDRIAKIGEVRISLTEIERKLKEILGFDAKAFVVTSSGRPSIGVVIALETSQPYDPRQVRIYRQALSESLEPLALPRVWRCVSQWQFNSQGKLDVNALMSLFHV